jgi:hypothetical protein
MGIGRRCLAGLLCAVVFGLVGPMSAEAESRTVTATARCAAGEVTVEVENQIGRRLYVAFARALTTSTGAVEDVAIENGASASLTLPTRVVMGTKVYGALVVTSAGRVTPPCGGSARIDLGPRPASDADRRAEWPAIAVRTISNLEALGAFDALYGLLHADAKQLVTPEQVTCWYAGYLAGTTTAEATVLSVTFGPWTWGGNGRTYDAAAADYRQPYWANHVEDDREDVEHLVLSRGMWRWFLGTDPAWLAALPDVCPAVQGSADGGAQAPSASAECDGAARWWGDASPRLTAVQGSVNDFIAIAGAAVRHNASGSPESALAETARENADWLAEQSAAQQASDPPAAAEELNARLVEAFDAYGQAMDYSSSVLGGGANPLLAEALKAHISTALDAGASALLRASGEVDAFTSACGV